MIYGLETWSVKRTQEDRLNVVEMKMLRCASGHTLRDQVENRAIQERTKVTEMHRKIQEKRLTGIYFGEMKTMCWKWKWK